MTLFDNLIRDNKINIVIGDFFTPNMPIRSTLATKILELIPVERTRTIENKNSLEEAAQLYLDAGIGTREKLIKIIVDEFDFAENSYVNFSDFFNMSTVNSFISFDYETNFKDELDKYVKRLPYNFMENPRNIEYSNKIPLYKIFGDISNASKIMITAQDIKRYKILPQYRDFIKLVRDELCKYETIVVGTDSQNIDFIKFFEFLLEGCIPGNLKPITFLISDSEITEEVANFIEKYDVTVLNLKETDDNSVSNTKNDEETIIFVPEEIKPTLEEPVFEEPVAEIKNEEIIEEKITEEEIKEEAKEEKEVFEEELKEEIKEEIKQEIKKVDNEKEDEEEIKALLRKKLMEELKEEVRKELNEKIREEIKEEVKEEIQKEINIENKRNKSQIIENEMNPDFMLRDVLMAGAIEPENPNQLKLLDENQWPSFEAALDEVNQVIDMKNPSLNINLETAAERKFRSFQLNTNPIQYTNIFLNETNMKNYKIESPTVKIGEEYIIGTKLKLIGNDSLKFLEIKTREFRIKFSVFLEKNGNMRHSGDYLEYEIFPGINSARFKVITQTFLNIFSGQNIIFSDGGINANISMENQLQHLKFSLIREFERSFEFVVYSLQLSQENKFYDTNITYHTIYLLENFIKRRTYETWINITFDKNVDFNKYNKLEIIRETPVDLIGFSGNIKEHIIIKEDLVSKTPEEVNNKFIFKNIKVHMILEKF